jgi:spore coat protein U-like protein
MAVGMLTAFSAPLLIMAANDIKLFGTLDTSDAFTDRDLVNGVTIGNFSIFKPGSSAAACPYARDAQRQCGAGDNLSIFGNIPERQDPVAGSYANTILIVC